MLGKHSGRHAVQQRCEELGVKLDRPELDRVYRGVIAHADREKTISDADLLKITETAKAPAPAADAPVYAPALTDFATTPAEKGYGHGV